MIGIGVRQCPSPWVWTARSPHGHRTVAARSRHGHRTVTARSPHGADERASSSHAPRVLVRSPRSHCQGTAPNPPKQSTASAVTAQSPHGTAIAQPRPGNVPGMERAAMDAKKTPGGGIVHCSDAGHGICKLVTKVNRISFSPAGTQQHREKNKKTQQQQHIPHRRKHADAALVVLLRRRERFSHRTLGVIRVILRRAVPGGQ